MKKMVPLRVDFAGGWLDVPSLSRPGGYIVNCAISPLVSVDKWPYEKRSGLGDSAAWAMLGGKDVIEQELKIAGWQDAAVIERTGLCAWRSGEKPELVYRHPDAKFLKNRMTIVWQGAPHDTANILKKKRDYLAILEAGLVAARSIVIPNLEFAGIKTAINMSYEAQLSEGMKKLEVLDGAGACKYLGSGWGGYALYLWDDVKKKKGINIEPYYKESDNV